MRNDPEEISGTYGVDWQGNTIMPMSPPPIKKWRLGTVKGED